ncbi:MAG: hypothetical protein ABJC19_05985 [Gemmatimonadota bacterium]
MRSTALTLLAATLLAIPLAAQQSPRTPTAPRRTGIATVRGDSAAVPRLTEAQHDKLDAIRNRYAKERRAEHEAAQARQARMHEEMNAVLTPAQRERMVQHKDGMRGRGGMRGHTDGMMHGQMRGGRTGHAAMGGRSTRPMMGRPAMPGRPAMGAMPARGRDSTPPAPTRPLR